MNPAIWHPEEHDWTRESHVARFMRAQGLESLAELRAASVRDTAWFWDAAVRDMGLEWTRPYTQVRDTARGFAWTRWFVGGQINVTHNCVDRHVREGHGAEPALLYEPDSGRADEALTVSFADLSQLVDRCAAAMRTAGLQRGECVAMYAPMQVPTVVVMFATMKLGARFVPIFCGYGEAALRERLQLCAAKLVFATRTLRRRGKATDTGSIVEAAVSGVPSVSRVVWTDTGDWREFLAGGVQGSPFTVAGAESREAVAVRRGGAERPGTESLAHARSHDEPPNGVQRGEAIPPTLVNAETRTGNSTTDPLAHAPPSPGLRRTSRGHEDRTTTVNSEQRTVNCVAEATLAEEPCLILFTSGTTGRPKGTVHTHAGCLVQMGKELRYAFDVRPGEPFFWVTDIGWMMGPWAIIGALQYRTPVVLFDGAPDYPDADRLWRTCARRGVVTLGCSPTLIRALRRAPAARGPEAFDLSRLRILGSTGEVWDEPSYHWYFERVGQRRCPVMNISGGTEIVGCHLSPTPLDPLKPCSLGGPGLGMDVDVFTDAGAPAGPGVTGHLVCKQPAPSMTKSFLGDDARYLETYFSRFPGVWYHGDWARYDEDGQWFLLGRTDDTLKVAGKRVGPAEVEGALTTHPAVSEAAVIGVPDEIKGTALVCFVVLKPGMAASEPELTEVLVRQLGKPLAPQRVHTVAALPKTRSGKIVRGSIARAYLGQAAGDLSSIENPAALEAIGTKGGKVEDRKIGKPA